jgi:hypothetical protein
VRERIGIAAYRDRGIERMREREGGEKTSKTQGDYASTIREQCYVVSQ